MFHLELITDLIQIESKDLGSDTYLSVEDKINEKYSNKVLHDIGLAICLYDIFQLEDGLIKPGDGCVYIKVQFRLIIFRPFIGEILIGWVSSCTEEGIKIRMEFFDDVWIPKNLLFEGCIFIPREQAWVWQTEGQDLYLDTNEKIRFRVEQCLFFEQSPKSPKAALEEDSNSESPFTVIASCQSDGMGLTSWWDD